MTTSPPAPTPARRLLPAAVLAAVVLVTAGCSTTRTATAVAGRPSPPPPAGPSKTVAPGRSGGVAATQRPAPVESNPPGDIPDNVAYVGYSSPGGRYSFVHPEGWASLVRGSTVTFTDKLNGITATAVGAAAAPSVASAGAQVAALRVSEPAFELRSVRPARLPAGAGVLIVFRRNSAPDQVTGKVFRDEVQRYEISRGGRTVVLELYGAVGSDNVDPYTKISQSLRLR